MRDAPAEDRPASACRRRAMRGWTVAVAVYFFAVFHRSSLGVAGLIAEHRFAISPGQLSVFVLLQIGVYAAMQVPTGVLVDRFGPRRMLVTAALLMGTGQLLFALVPSYGAALLARTLLGCGDAMTFISVLRFTAAHFSPRRYPVLVAVTSMIGTVGNLLATLPLAVLLRTVGWDASYASAAICSLVTGAVVWLLLDDRSAGRSRPDARARIGAGIAAVAGRVRGAWSLPGTRLGFWLHFSSMSTATALGVLWGDPYLQKSLGLGAAAAGAVLMAGVLLSVLVSPLFGALITRHPAARVPVATAQCVTTVAGWAALLAAAGDHPPVAVAVPLFVFTTLGGPASMAAFALARDYNRAATLGTASGVVNVGGFLATVVICVGIGAVLDALGGTDAHTLRLALLVALAVQLFGTLRMVAWYRRVRAVTRHGRTRATPCRCRCCAASGGTCRPRRCASSTSTGIRCRARACARARPKLDLQWRSGYCLLWRRRGRDRNCVTPNRRPASGRDGERRVRAGTDPVRGSRGHVLRGGCAATGHDRE